MTQVATAMNTTGLTNGNGNDNSKRERAVPSAIAAITKIGKILDQLSASDRKRVLAFINESNT